VVFTRRTIADDVVNHYGATEENRLIVFEAVNWLVGEGLLFSRPDANGTEFVKLSRRGRALVSDEDEQAYGFVRASAYEPLPQRVRGKLWVDFLKGD
jgi:hypothetical protein